MHYPTALASLVLASLAAAQSIPIANAGFEQPPTAPGTFQTTSPPPGWSGFGNLNFGARTIGVVNPASTALYAVPAPEGANIGVTFLLDNPSDQSVFTNQVAGLQQTLATPLALASRYTLRVEVGNMAFDPTPPHSSFQFTGFPGYRVELLAGGTVLAVDANTLLPAEGTFETSVVVFDTGATHANENQALGLRLLNLNASVGIEVNFDDVRLERTSLETGIPYCFGAPGQCPCGNTGLAGHGCANSVDARGARLFALGNASVAADTLVLHGSAMPSSSALYFQGTAQTNSLFGDGLRCAGGAVIRLGTKINVAGRSLYPEAGDVAVSVRGAVAPGETRMYQVWYRNAAVFCTPATFNLSNGVEVAWGG